MARRKVYIYKYKFPFKNDLNLMLSALNNIAAGAYINYYLRISWCPKTIEAFKIHALIF